MSCAVSASLAKRKTPPRREHHGHNPAHPRAVAVGPAGAARRPRRARRGQRPGPIGGRLRGPTAPLVAEVVRGVTAQILPGLVIGVVVAVASAFVSHLLTRSRERERWEREDEAQRERWEREDRIRFQAERMGVYRDYLGGVQRALESGGEGFDADRMAPLLQEIKLIASKEVAEAADALFTDGSYAQHVGRRFHENRESGAKVEAAMLRFEESYRWFTNAARAELGISKELPE